MTTVSPAELQQRAAQQQQPQQASIPLGGSSVPLGGAAHERPTFAPLGGAGSGGVVQNELRRVAIPPHRMTPLRTDWPNIMTPVVNHMKLQIRVNPEGRCIEMKVSSVAEMRHLVDAEFTSLSGATVSRVLWPRWAVVRMHMTAWVVRMSRGV